MWCFSGNRQVLLASLFNSACRALRASRSSAAFSSRLLGGGASDRTAGGPYSPTILFQLRREGGGCWRFGFGFGGCLRTVGIAAACLRGLVVVFFFLGVGGEEVLDSSSGSPSSAGCGSRGRLWFFERGFSVGADSSGALSNNDASSEPGSCSFFIDSPDRISWTADLLPSLKWPSNTC